MRCGQDRAHLLRVETERLADVMPKGLRDNRIAHNVVRQESSHFLAKMRGRAGVSHQGVGSQIKDLALVMAIRSVVRQLPGQQFKRWLDAPLM